MRIKAGEALKRRTDVEPVFEDARDIGRAESEHMETVRRAIAVSTRFVGQSREIIGASREDLPGGSDATIGREVRIMNKQEELEMAERHVLSGERVVASQRLVLEKLRRNGLPTEMAENLLQCFELSLSQFRAHLASMLSEASTNARAGPPTPG